MTEFTREMRLAATPARCLEWEPYSYWRLAPFAGKYVSIDARGLRKTWTPPPTDDDAKRLRVFFLGASVMWGHGARDDFTIPSLTTKRLSEEGFAVEPTNFGQLGFVSTQTAIELQRQLQGGQIPDVVVVLDGLNDMAAAYLTGVAGDSLFESERRREFRMSNRPALGLIRHALSNTALGRAFRHQPPPGSLEYASGERPSREQMAIETLNVWLANIRTIEALRKAYGFAAIYSCQPTVFLKTQPSTFEAGVQRNNDKLREMYEPYYRLAQQFFQQVASGQIADAPHLVYLPDAFNSPDWAGKTAFLDHFHLTEAGNATVAERFAIEMAPILTVRGVAAQHD
ncbi:MAG: SGNH/GDSL hydrolase family protein [Pirellulales bacterium]